MFHILTGYTRRAGYFINGINGKAEESDILTCGHCGKVLYLHRWANPYTPPWHEDGGWCRKEMKPLCGGMHGCAEAYYRTRSCNSIDRLIDEFTREQYRQAQFRKVSGLEPQPGQSIIISGR